MLWTTSLILKHTEYFGTAVKFGLIKAKSLLQLMSKYTVLYLVDNMR